MATERSSDSGVTRTYRAAIRLGEDYITLEETITMSLDASDEDIQQAVALGWRVYQAQQSAIEQQIAALRDHYDGGATPVIREPDAPASDKQRSYLARLQRDLHWTEEEMVGYSSQRGFELLALTKGQASELIDELKRLADERPTASVPATPETTPVDFSTAPISERQMNALTQLARTRGVNLYELTRQRFNIELENLSMWQAGELIDILQKRD
ncbi:MAG: hypothetical protein HC876_09965 [Chloroflexaceae bacterium]|nr:hypothetical protein [Chloroflexaceae bacterium]NJO83326.1 hypothetical protein [Blastochloris sp.]